MPDNHRRPLKVRGAVWAKNIAAWLATKNITPNQISVFSVFFACLAAVCLYLHNQISDFRNILLICSALFIQCRLLCNLFDGMVAVEGGKSTKAGELFNDIPDRIADPMILIAMAYGIGHLENAIELGWLAALLAVLTAYVRTLSASIGVPADFRGPMAKQQRMAIVTILSLISVVEQNWWAEGTLLFYGLLIISIGCIITLIRRVRYAYSYLESS